MPAEAAAQVASLSQGTQAPSPIVEHTPFGQMR